ncbi:hypothetical protein GCM10010424_67550 [Streptomyces lienomycini]
MSGSSPETAAATVSGRCAAMEPTEGCVCWTSAWLFGCLMNPFFRATRVSGASEGTEGSGSVGFIR